MRNSNQKHAGLVEDRLNNCVVYTSRVDGRTQLLYGGRLFESGGHDRAALEINAEIESFRAVGMELMPVECSPHTGEHQHDRNADKEPALTEPVDLDIVK